MASPGAVLAAKAALFLASDKRTWTAIASVAAAVLTPFILIIVVMLSALSGTASHNNAAVDLAFHGGYLSSQLPADYRMYIEKMRDLYFWKEWDTESFLHRVNQKGPFRNPLHG